MRGARALLGLALIAQAACERADFESLGTFMTRAITQSYDAGSPASEPEPADMPIVTVDAGLAAATAAGQPAAAGGGTGGAAGSAGQAGTGGSTEPPGELSGILDTTPFTEVEAAYVIGRSDEFGTTTVYLIDSSVTCDQVSKILWLAPLPSKVQVIEVSFPSSAPLNTPVTGAIVGYARGGMYGFQKTLASARTLILSQNVSGVEVAGTLEATFGAGRVSGTFRAQFCANGVSF